MKDILLRIESGPYGEIIKFHSLCDDLSEYEQDVIAYSCLMLESEKCITLESKRYIRSNGIVIKHDNWDDNEGAQFSCHVFR